MADEPSIDEILASLDQLLREGEGRNDEPVQLAPPPADEAPSPHPHDAPTPHFFEVLGDEVEAGHADAGEVEAAATSQADAPSGAEPGVRASRLYVLTDAMMVEDQPSLPLGMGDEPRADALEDDEEAMRQALAIPESPEPGLEDEVEAEPVPLAPTESGPGDGEPPGYGADETGPEEVSGAWPGDDAIWEYGEEELGAESAMHGEPEAIPDSGPDAEGMDAAAPEPAWDADEMQALVDQVTDDVCSAMAEQLPEMIRRALDERLSAFIEAHTEQQDTGPQA